MSAIRTPPSSPSYRDNFDRIFKAKEEPKTFSRRNRIDLYTPAERAIYDAMGVVEQAGAHPLLTEAVILLGQAKDKVADFVDGQQ